HEADQSRPAVALPAGAQPLRRCRAAARDDRRQLMIELIPHEDGWVLPVRAQPGARKNAVAGEQAGALKLYVTAPPEDGKANKAILEVLRNSLGLKRSQLDLLSGLTSREKRVLIRGLEREELESRL